MGKTLFIVTLIMFVSTASAPTDDLPIRYDFSHYQAMVDRSPFAAFPDAQLVGRNFAEGLYIANAAHSDEADLVTIVSTKDLNFKRYLTTKGPVDGYSIVKIEWSNQVGETKVTITKDDKYVVLKFNQASLYTQPDITRSDPVDSP